MATEALPFIRVRSRVRPRDAAAWLWKRAWPPLGAAVLFLAAWQLLTLAGVWPDYLLPGPIPVLTRLSEDLRDPALYNAMRITGTRALIGYSLAIVLGLAMGLAVSRSAVVRSAVGSLITGLQSMPSIAWFPLAILLFGITDAAITFVVVLGAAPAIANGLITGIDHIPPLLLRYGRAAGARNWTLYHRIVLPAALPSFVGGLKQGWAFAWRSLMAGELLVIIAQQPSIGERLAYAREFADAEGLLSMMIIILVIGIVVDRLFAAADHWIRRRWGLIEQR